MIRNYFKITLRNIRRNLLFSVINIMGLAIGMASVILIFLWVRSEFSYEKFHDNVKNIYRAYESELLSSGENVKYAVLPAVLSPILKEEYPEIINTTRYTTRGTRRVYYNNQHFSENQFGFVDPSFFEIFTFPEISGDPKTALLSPNNIVITRATAIKYFGEENPIGKTLSVDNQFDFTVTAVVEDPPFNTQLQFDFLVNFETLTSFGYNLEGWGTHSHYIYVQLTENIPYKEVEEKIKNLFIQYNEQSTFLLHLQPIADIHLYSDSVHGIGNDGDIILVYAFSLIALVIILIACINFMNLYTAQASIRLREIGLRKVVGARRNQLIFQFIGESIILTFIAHILAMFMVELVLPKFNNFVGKELYFDYGDFTMLLSLLTLIVATGFLAGCYPALYLSSFKPLNVLLKGKNRSSKSGGFRKVSVITQFTFSIILCITVIVIYKQVNFLKNKNWGYDKDQIVYFYLPEEIRSNHTVLKEELLKNPNIINISAVSDVPLESSWSTSNFGWEGKQPEDLVLMHCITADEDFIETFKMEIIEGRYYSEDIISDSNAIVLNESAIKAMGIHSPIGKGFGGGNNPAPIIGIVKDYQFNNLNEPVQPLAIIFDQSEAEYLCAKINALNFTKTIDQIEEKWEKFASGHPYEIRSLDEDFAHLIKAEQTNGNLIKYFTFLAIFISCLGLFGLSAFIAEQKNKEIGIRKAFGSSNTRIILLLSKEFSKWVIIAFCIAAPVGGFLMNRWLMNYAFRTKINLWIFLLAGIVALIIALLTVSYQAIRAANANPGDSLRYE